MTVKDVEDEIIRRIEALSDRTKALPQNAAAVRYRANRRDELRVLLAWIRT